MAMEEVDPPFELPPQNPYIPPVASRHRYSLAEAQAATWKITEQTLPPLHKWVIGEYEDATYQVVRLLGTGKWQKSGEHKTHAPLKWCEIPK